MLPKKNRLDRKLVENIFKNGRFLNSLNLSFKFLPQQSNTPHPNPLLIKERGQNANTRISFITPKTASKKAVIRNLLRRRGYAVLKKYINHLPSGFTGAFVFGKKSVENFGGKKKTNYNPIQNLENEIKNIIAKIR
ncbi:MAG: ribonuclease P protein component [Patescibacteria group bacterium]